MTKVMGSKAARKFTKGKRDFEFELSFQEKLSNREAHIYNCLMKEKATTRAS